MRQGQQSRRGRNRGGGGGRKPQNQMSRNFESTGPDVKIRGTAMHIADKYMSLARDAMSSGDIVAAENYLQHAEHYNRIVMAAQAQAQPGQPQDVPQQQMNGNGRNGYPDFLYRDFQSGDDDDEDDDEPSLNGYHNQPAVQPRPQPHQQRPHQQNYQPQNQPQPVQQGFHEAQPAYVEGGPRNAPKQGAAGDDERQNPRRPRRRRPAPNMNGQPRDRADQPDGDGGDEGGAPPEGSLL